MTREEAKEYLINISYKLGTMGIEYLTEKDGEKMRDAIHALERESVLDKIRAEIKALSPEPTAYDVVDGNPIKDAVWETLADVLQIIDKYKSESER
jgi:hypothetical protein